MITIEYYLLIASVLILLSIGIAKISDNLGVPTLILFLGVGMLAGSEGLGGINFDDARLAQSIGILALVFILFSGGLNTSWKEVKPSLSSALSLATIGVFTTAFITGIFTYYFLDIPIVYSILLGAIISSTDAAAVFSVLSAKGVRLKSPLKPLLELESGSNDPMAVFLTIGLIQIALNDSAPLTDIIKMFFLQMGIGALGGLFFGKVIILFINYLKATNQGVYAVLSLSFAGLVFAATSLLQGSGFLAVYIAGIMINNHKFVQKKSLLRFFDGMAWLSQIGMFLTLGLLIFPSRLLPIITTGLLLSLVLMFIARPISVFISLAFSKFKTKEKLFISWVGLRGAVPIVLATFPLMANLPYADLFFSLVFFIVLTSTLLQGWSLMPAAKLFKVNDTSAAFKPSPLEIAPIEGVNAELIDFFIPYNSTKIGMRIRDLGLPSDSLIILITRKEKYIVPSGSTVIEEGDIILALITKESLPSVQKIFMS